MLKNLGVLTLNPIKCELSNPKVTFLGHTVCAEGISTSSGKVPKVREWPPPQSALKVQSFLGLASFFRTLIPAYSRFVFPFTQLTEKGREFKWIQKCEAAFKVLKTALTSAPIVAYPDVAQKAAIGQPIGTVLTNYVLTSEKDGERRPQTS